MLKKQNIICISSIDWDFIWQGPQETMSLLAKNGNRVFYIENTGIRMPSLRDFSRLKSRLRNWRKGIRGVRKEADNLYVYSPLILPFPYNRLARWINKRIILSVLNKWMKVMNFSGPILWLMLPSGLVYDLASEIDSNLMIYYCLDNLKAVSASTRKLERYEQAIIEKSDLVFVTSDDLLNYCLRFNRNVYKFPVAVDISKFNIQKIASSSFPEDMKSIRKPVIGFSGGIRQWVDKGLIRYLAKNNPECSFVFVGPIQTDVEDLMRFGNIFFLGQKKHEDLPYYVNYFDIAIIPYIVNEFTNSIYPAKLNEYFALGKPVVSTALNELVSLHSKYGEIIYTAHTYEEFNALLKKSLREDGIDLINRRVEYAKSNSWDNRIEEMCEVIEAVIKRKEENILLNWQKKLVEIYKVFRRRIVRIIFTLSIILLLVFYTPLIWFLASPLKIANPPQKSDCIIVFAGGVGESGQPGQGYEERTEYAVELYKQGYAKNIIFSSGYVYVFKEPLVMKALAISLGMPEESIFLEDKAKNTYENVRFTKEILERKNWNHVLLVSSPYNMRRASLVFNKIAKEIKVNYTPIPKSLFYSHKTRDSYGRRIWKRVSLKQIRAILHEYLGILYYGWKGYI